MNDSKMTTMEGRPVSPSIHPYMLFATDAEVGDIETELQIKICQARGIAGLLTQIEPSCEIPNNGTQQTAWMLDELLEAIGTLADMMCDKLRDEIKPEAPGGES